MIPNCRCSYCVVNNRSLKCGCITQWTHQLVYVGQTQTTVLLTVFVVVEGSTLVDVRSCCIEPWAPLRPEFDCMWLLLAKRTRTDCGGHKEIGVCFQWERRLIPVNGTVEGYCRGFSAKGLPLCDPSNGSTLSGLVVRTVGVWEVLSSCIDWLRLLFATRTRRLCERVEEIGVGFQQ